ncbi:MAG TPA: protein kinase [Polyangiales bacterium]|nr:protein kinase [Polyangiales bacterium]
MARSSGLAASAEESLIAGRYRIEALLGKGGMGAVYAALDSATGRRLALKRTFGSVSPKVLELFRREFHTLHGLRHPNIIEVYDYGSDADGLFYTMELLEGGDLGHAAPLPWPVVCSYLRQVAMLLGLLHARRLLHRDISPRNLWVLPDGRLKLIDFGALCPFGVPTEVVGTPPFIAPEWLHERRAGVIVDQRADLYALGALAYWLLTSVHAYAARSVNDLPRVWGREPAPPSSLAKLVEDRALPAIPAELDALVASLLRRDPAARPATTELLIDRIDAIAGPAQETTDHAVRGYVHSKAFVGRSVERQLVEQYLRLGRAEGRVIAIEGVPGMGRSRLLEELSVLGRLSGATSLSVRGERERAFGVANAIALGLLESAPGEALAAAKPHAGQLAQLSPELQRRLDVAGPLTRDVTPRGREQLQRALTEWVFALAEQRKLLLLVDDLEQSDEESAAWLAALARQCSTRRLLLVASLVHEPSSQPPLHLQMFRAAALVMRLSPLTAAEVHELLSSVFGPVAYLQRVADSLYRVSQGSPAHCLELVEHLVDSGLARYAEGTWALPGQLADESLPRSRGEMHATRLERIGERARSLAELLSIHDGRLMRRECLALSELGEHDTAEALVELTLCGVLIETDQGYGFAHGDVRESLLRGLSVERRTRAHERLGTALLAAASDPIDSLPAALHLFHAGDRAQCQQLVRTAVVYLFEGHRERMHIATPLLEEAVALYRAAGLGKHALATPLGALAAASFFVDRRLADRYGVEALDTIEDLLCFDVARKLERYIGKKAALYAALARAGIRARRLGPGAPSVQDALRMLIGAVVGLNAVATSGLDLAVTERCRRAFEPLSAFSDREIAGFVRRCTLSISAILTEKHAATLAELRTLASMMDSGVVIKGMPDHLKGEFLAGCLFSIGIMESWRQSPETLVIADRIEPWSPMAALNADHLRAVYYSTRGDRSRGEHFRQRVETRALQVGAAWQVVSLGPVEDHLTSLWIQDALLAKRAAAELERLSRELPTFRNEARRARATYLVLCGRYREAIVHLSADDSPRSLAGWSRTQGILARAHNRLAEHARARELCVEALAGRSEEDLSFVMMNLHVQIELVLADAALGDVERARSQSERLLAKFADRAGPLALGALHETRARVALSERDFETARAHCAAMRRCYAPTQITSLLELTDQLAAQLTRSERGEVPASAGTAVLFGDDAHLITRMRLILTHTEATFEARAQRGLQIALDLTGAQEGFIISRAAPTGAVHIGDRQPSRDLVAWAQAQLEATRIEETAVVTDQTVSETGVMSLGENRYCVIVLPQSEGAEPAALVLGFQDMNPRTPSHEVLSILAGHLVEPKV